MKALARFEAACERLVEGSVGRLFRTELQPAEIGRKLEQAMGEKPVVAVEATLVPNDFRVTLHPADAATFAAYETALCRQLEGWLGEVAARHGWTLVDAVRVRLEAEETVPRRQIRVAAAIAAIPGSNGRPPPNPISHSGQFRPGPPGLRLRIESGSQAGQELLLEPPAATVGRAADNDVVLAADDISRHHARIEWGRGGARVTDLGSTNGTALNGRPVTATGAGFGPGDELAFGSVRLAVLALPLSPADGRRRR